MKRKTHLTSDQRAEVARFAKEQLAEQADAVCNRAYNDFLVAMVQADIPTATINKVASLVPMVEQYIDEKIRNPTRTLKGAGDRQNIADADLWVRMYLTDNGVDYFGVKEVIT